MGTEVIRFRPSGRPVVPSCKKTDCRKLHSWRSAEALIIRFHIFSVFFSFRLLIFDTSAVI